MLLPGNRIPLHGYGHRDFGSRLRSLARGDRDRESAEKLKGQRTQGSRHATKLARGRKEGREVFELETRISGALNEIDIENHIASAIRTMSAVFRHGGRAKWGGS